MKILIKTVSWTLNQSYKWARTEVPKSLKMYGLFFIKVENVLCAYKQDSPSSKNRVSHMIWYPWVFWKISNMIDFIDNFSKNCSKNVKLCIKSVIGEIKITFPATDLSLVIQRSQIKMTENFENWCDPSLRPLMILSAHLMNKYFDKIIEYFKFETKFILDKMWERLTK